MKIDELDSFWQEELMSDEEDTFCSLSELENHERWEAPLPKLAEDISSFMDKKQYEELREDMFFEAYYEEASVLSYENWEGKILQIQASEIRAKLINTQGKYASRIVEIDKSLFSKNKISRELEEGDRFELTFKQVRKPNRQIVNEESIRMIEKIKRTSEQIQKIVDDTLGELSFLFK